MTMIPGTAKTLLPVGDGDMGFTPFGISVGICLLKLEIAAVKGE